METASAAPVKLIPLGGLGEIGLNSMVLEYGDDILVIDAGLMFPEEAMLGIDIVIPDFRYLQERREKIRGVVITHGHEDHIGALPFFLRDFNVPVYGTPLVCALIREKLREHNLAEKVKLVRVAPRDRIRVGPFEVEFIQVCHSIPDSVGLAVRTPVGLIVHSGDFKVDNTPVDGKTLDVARFSACGEEGVLLLMSDSTNAERDGHTVSERDIGRTLRDIFRERRGRIIVAVFASSIHRIQQLVNIARETGRMVLLNGRSMLTNVRIARELGMLDFDPSEEITLQDLPAFADNQILMITTGSQGEPMSALTRMALSDHRQLKVKPGDTIVLSSRFIPGNERAIQNIMNNLARQGAEVIYEQVRHVHVSGHAYREELKAMINMVRPRYFVPVHGEYRHLVKHREIALHMGIPPERCLLAEDGDVLALTPGKVAITGRGEAGRILVDGKGVGDVGNVVLRDRRHLAQDGLVICSLVISAEGKEILAGPDILSRGFILEEIKPEVLDEAKCVVLEVFDRFLGEGLEFDTGDLRVEIQRELKRYFQRLLERRPVIYSLITEV